MLPIKHSRNCLVSKSITVNDFLTEAQEHSKGKVCTKCKEHKSLSEFSKQITGKNGLRPYCKSCAKVDHDNMCRFKVWFSSKKARVKYNGNAEFTIEPTDIPGVRIRETITTDRMGRKHTGWEAVEYLKVCSKWGIELDWDMNGIQYNSPSLDRINPKLGYIPGNVRLVCNSYNMAKLNCPPDEWDVIEKNMARYVLFGE